MNTDRQVARRTVLLGGVGAAGLALAGCFGGRSDTAAVQEALQEAVESLSEYVAGNIQYQDGFSQGTVMSGNIVVGTSTRAETERALERVHETLLRAYLQQSNVRNASVKFRAYPPDREDEVVTSADIAAPPGEVSVDTDDLIEQFDIG